ncbi:MAG: protocatechuate 3,4-dioxygenase [Gammaproteobacteria bacterium]|jgi:hypothetical protein|nr:protocatechuate 3,4-dioxygenase [Gammaproteobacteria bacterium]
MSKIISFSHARDMLSAHSSELQDTMVATESEAIALNKLCASLIIKENQKRFRAFPDSYCREYGLSLEQIHAVTDLDIMRLLDLGAAIDNLKKLTATYGLDILDLCIEQTGKSLDEVKALMASN